MAKLGKKKKKRVKRKKKGGVQLHPCYNREVVADPQLHVMGPARGGT